MNCTALQNVDHAYLDGELVDAERLAVELHLQSCAECRQRVDAERAQLALLKATLKQAQPRAPQALRDRLSSQLNRDTQRARSARLARWSAAAAGLAVCAIAAQQGYRSFQRRLYTEDAVSRHTRQYPMEIERPSPEQLEAWFGGKLDHRVAVPRLINSVAAGGRLLNVRDHQAAYIRYDAPRPGGARHLGLFVFSDKPGDVDIGDQPVADKSNGYNVVSWRDGDIVYQLVTDLDEGDVRAMLPPARDTTAHPANLIQPVGYQPGAAPPAH